MEIQRSSASSSDLTLMCQSGDRSCVTIGISPTLSFPFEWITLVTWRSGWQSSSLLSHLFITIYTERTLASGQRKRRGLIVYCSTDEWDTDLRAERSWRTSVYTNVFFYYLVLLLLLWLLFSSRNGDDLLALNYARVRSGLIYLINPISDCIPIHWLTSLSAVSICFWRKSRHSGNILLR